MNWFTSFALILAAFSGSFAFPNDIVKCKISDEKCLAESANEVLRKYYAGHDEINLNPIDPLFIPHAKVVQESGPVRLDSTITNSSISGFSKGKIEKFEGFDKNLMKIKIRAPLIKFNGTYEAKSSVIGIPINGAGPYKVIFEKFSSLLIFNLTRVKKDGNEHFKIMNSWMNFDIEDGEMDLPDLEFLINAFLNASFNLIKNSLTPVVSDVWAKIFMEELGAVFDKVPINELFLE